VVEGRVSHVQAEKVKTDLIRDMAALEISRWRGTDTSEKG
jgi:hypothetical protein